MERAEGIAVTRIGVRAPIQNAVAERIVQSVKSECLDHFVVFGTSYWRHILSKYLTYYHHFRPQQGLDNRPLGWVEPAVSEADQPEVVCHERLGGLLRHYQGVVA